MGVRLGASTGGLSRRIDTALGDEGGDVGSQRDSRNERMSLPAGMELVIPPPPREEQEDRRPADGTSRASRLGPFPPLVGGGSSRSDGERPD